MFTPSDLNSRILVAWIPAYVALLIHGFFTVPVNEFFEIFVIYPMLTGSALGIFNYWRRNENEEFLEQVGIPYTTNLTLAVVLLILLPLAGVLFALSNAQLSGTYDDVSWIVIVFGGLIGGEVGEKLKKLNQ